MTLQLIFTPAGRVAPLPPPSGAERTSDDRLQRLCEAFEEDSAAGLFHLAAESVPLEGSPSAAWWRQFAANYLSALCHRPAAEDAPPEPVPPPPAEQLRAWAAEVPPMRGAEYVDAPALERLWSELDGWVRRQVSDAGGGLASFLQRHAPLWHQVGRVAFHLAENRRDEDYPFAFLATYAPSLGRGRGVRYQPLREALRQYAGEKNRAALVKLLTPVHRASQEIPWVRELVDSGAIYQPLAWTPAEAYRLLRAAPRLEESGLLVRLPDWWKQRPRPRVAVTIGDRRQRRFDANAMLDFKVELALGEQRLSDEEWQALLAAEEGLVLLRGQWVEVDRQRLGEALEHWQHLERQAQDGLSFVEGMRLLAGAPRELGGEDEPSEGDRSWSFVRAGEWLGQRLAELRQPEQAAGPPVGRSLRATLRDYQRTGVQWLWLLSHLGLGACLADDMGLGKTVQVLALLVALKEQRGKPKRKASSPALLVLPASLLANWKAEIERFAPTLSARFVHPSEASAEEFSALAAAPQKHLRGVDVVLTTYGMLLRQDWLLEQPWGLVVLDEAQAIKNPAARQTKAVKRLRAAARIALSGTPVENRLGELWSLFDFLCPGLLGSQAAFKRFVKQLDSHGQQRYAPLRSLVQPYILRRLKTDRSIIADLPEKTEVKAFCGLAKRQAALYAKLVKELNKQLESAEGMQRRGLVLSYLMRLKQLCNHPSQLLGDGRYAPGESGKFARLRELTEEIASRQEKVLLFTQFREICGPLLELLTGLFGREGAVLHGGTPVRRRRAIVEQFQADAGPPFLVLSLKAGGTGLNLTAASQVIHFDRWWNPAVENQATDRAFRIGQERNVLVHKFVCRGTIEERIDALIDEKRQLAADLIDGGAEQLLTEMGNEELIDLVSLDLEKCQM